MSILLFVGFTVVLARACDEEIVHTTSCKYSQYQRLFDLNGRLNGVKKALVCPNRFDNRTLSALENFYNRCISAEIAANKNKTIQYAFLMFAKSTPNWPILNRSLSVFKIYDLLDLKYTYNFINFKGFDIDSDIEVKNSWLRFKMDFNLFKQNKLIKDCADFADSNSQGFIFRQTEVRDNNNDFWIKGVYFKQARAKKPICSLFFRNARIVSFYLQSVANSFYAKNMLTFANPVGNTTTALNSSILYLDVQNIYGVDIDSSFLNAQIFARIKGLSLFGHLNSIDHDVFKPFRDLRQIAFENVHLIRLIRKQGIRWIRNINSDLHQDPTNQTEIDLHADKIFTILLFPNREFWIDKHNHYFDNEDFCLFVDYPFSQLVFVVPHSTENTLRYRNATPFTCTELWLYQFYQQAGQIYQYTNKLKSSNFEKCGFQERVRLCRTSKKFHLYAKKTPVSLTSFDVILFLEFVFIVLAPMVSLFGIVTNLMVIYVIFKRENKKTMQEKHYVYMSIHCTTNLIVFATQVVNLVNECQYPYGFLCSSIQQAVAIQYVKIVFGEFFNSLFRLLSNFAYLGFSLCRLSKLGKHHGKFVVFINDVSIIKFMAVSVAISAGFSVFKALQYKINLFFIFDHVYPIPVFQIISDWQHRSGYVAIFIINILYNVFNYFLFVFVHLVVDLVLTRKLLRVLGEKEEKMRVMKRTQKEIDETSKENEETKRRAILMVILNSTLNLLTKVPLMIMSVNDLRLLIQRPYFELEKEYEWVSLHRIDETDATFTFKLFCSASKSCLVFQSFGNCLFLWSLAITLFFLKRFDKNFRNAFKKCFLAKPENQPKPFLTNSLKMNMNFFFS